MTSPAAYFKEWRKKYPERSAAARKSWRTRNNHKTRAHAKVQTELEAGRLIRQSCVKCDNPKSQAHHEDYSKPLDIIWLCAAHHKQRHAEIRKELKSPSWPGVRVEH